MRREQSQAADAVTGATRRTTRLDHWQQVLRPHSLTKSARVDLNSESQPRTLSDSQDKSKVG